MYIECAPCVIAPSPQFGVRGGDADQVTQVTRQVRGDALLPALTCKQRWRACGVLRGSSQGGGELGRGHSTTGACAYRCPCEAEF